MSYQMHYFYCAEQPPSNLNKLQILMEEGCISECRGSAALTSAQVMFLLLVQGSQWEQQVHQFKKAHAGQVPRGMVRNLQQRVRTQCQSCLAVKCKDETSKGLFKCPISLGRIGSTCNRKRIFFFFFNFKERDSKRAGRCKVNKIGVLKL